MRTSHLPTYLGAFAEASHEEWHAADECFRLRRADPVHALLDLFIEGRPLSTAFSVLLSNFSLLVYRHAMDFFHMGLSVVSCKLSKLTCSF